MLVLSRKLGEKIIIGDNITVTVLETTGNRVRLGISAPNEVRVLRSELVGVWDGPCRPDFMLDSQHEETSCPQATGTATMTPRSTIGRDMREYLSARRRKG